jgi:hypothetical protein
MKNILWIKHEGGELVAGFSSVEDANAFLRRQSQNPHWLAQWTIRYCVAPDGSLVITATVSDRVVLRFD